MSWAGLGSERWEWKKHRQSSFMLQREGFRIKMDALGGPYLGDRIFKLPNPIFRGIVEGDDGIQIKRSELLEQQVLFTSTTETSFNRSDAYT